MDFALVFFVGTHLCMDGDCHDDGLRSLECVVQSDMLGWFGLDSLTDRRKSVGTEDDGGIGDNNMGV